MAYREDWSDSSNTKALVPSAALKSLTSAGRRRWGCGEGSSVTLLGILIPRFSKLGKVWFIVFLIPTCGGNFCSGERKRLN